MSIACKLQTNCKAGTNFFQLPNTYISHFFFFSNTGDGNTKCPKCAICYVCIGNELKLILSLRWYAEAVGTVGLWVLTVNRTSLQLLRLYGDSCNRLLTSH